MTHTNDVYAMDFLLEQINAHPLIFGFRVQFHPHVHARIGGLLLVTVFVIAGQQSPIDAGIGRLFVRL